MVQEADFAEQAKAFADKMTVAAAQAAQIPSLQSPELQGIIAENKTTEAIQAGRIQASQVHEAKLVVR